MKKTILVSFLFAGLLLTTSCSSNSPEDVAKKFFKCYLEQDYEGVKSLIDFYSETESEITEERIDDFMKLFMQRAAKSNERDGKVKNIEIVSENIDNSKNSGEVICKITFESGETKEDFVPVKMDKNGKWRIGVDLSL